MGPSLLQSQLPSVQTACTLPSAWVDVYKRQFEDQTPTLNKDQNGNLVTLTYKDCDNIIVHVLKEGEGTTSRCV